MGHALMGADDLAHRADTVRLPAMEAAARAERDGVARLKLASLALDRPDPAAWLGEILDVLGLRGESRPANAPRSAARDVQRGNGRTVHGTTTGYKNHHCRCDLCRDAMRRYRKGVTE